MANLDSMLSENMGVLTSEDVKDIEEARKSLSRIAGRHKAILRTIKLKRKIANAFTTAFSEIKTNIAKVISDRQQAISSHNDSIEAAAASIANAVEKKARVADFAFQFYPIPVMPKENPVGDLTFVAKLGVDSLTPDLLNSILSSVL